MKDALEALGTELSIDQDQIQALKRLIELDAVWILTIDGTLLQARKFIGG